MKTLDLSDGYISKAERALLGLCYTCASAPSVEVTTLGSLCDFHWTGDHGNDSFQSKHLSTKLRIKPPVLKWHQNSQTRHRSGSKLPIDPKEYFTTIDASEYCLARWTSWLAKIRSLTLGAGKHCWLNDTCVQGLRAGVCPRLTTTPICSTIHCSQGLYFPVGGWWVFVSGTSFGNGNWSEVFGIFLLMMSDFNCSWTLSVLDSIPQNSPLPIRHFL